MRAFCASLLLVALAASGCWELRPGGGPNKAPGQSAGTALPLRPAPIITPEQVTDENARQKSDALREEMLEAQRDLPPAPISANSPAAKPAR